MTFLRMTQILLLLPHTCTHVYACPIPVLTYTHTYKLYICVSLSHTLKCRLLVMKMIICFYSLKNIDPVPSAWCEWSKLRACTTPVCAQVNPTSLGALHTPPAPWRPGITQKSPTFWFQHVVWVDLDLRTVSQQSTGKQAKVATKPHPLQPVGAMLQRIY